MSHIHVPDGIISVVWWGLGYVLTFTIMFFIFKTLDKEEARKKIPFTGIAAAIMLLGMSVPLFIVPVHLSLAVLTGILIGPKLGFLAVFVVNIMLALFGHGGITIVGLNTLVVGSEVLIGSCLFKYFSKRLHKVGSVFIATAIALLISMTLMVGIIGVTTGVTEALPHHHHGEHDYYEDQHAIEEVEDVWEKMGDEVATIRYFAFTGWTAVVLILMAGIALESTGTALIIRYFLQVRPDLIIPTQDV
ncbi:energy-coupling factor ABC transporter permease [Natronincola ferrireducens]|uniref:Cobalt/nickel transport system permease protein n=1 Tax=Natronincola ferrireducens TaxID=393762 RepID=A0A1G8Y850_9FIRM|nr:energy-coupling factor ABC transporter permease [Natronincola ferrireducens]SDJ99059.1 cobalt/nickel transport system permease protein [Natronincola ferrireducens]